MKIESITQSINNKRNSTPNYSQKHFEMKPADNDVFVKNTSAVSFSGNDDQRRQLKNNLYDALAVTGLVAIPFLISLTAGAALVKGQNPEQIFLSDGSYLCDSSDLSVKSDKVTADGNDGKYKVTGTGIDLDPARFDYVDAKNGIYKNFDGSADINLLENKYVDAQNGIFIDQEKELSLIYNGDHFEYIGLPSFTSGYPTNGLSGWQMPQNENSNGAQDNFAKTKDFVHSILGAKNQRTLTNPVERNTVPVSDKNVDKLPSASPKIKSFDNFLNQVKAKNKTPNATSPNFQQTLKPTPPVVGGDHPQRIIEDER